MKNNKETICPKCGCKTWEKHPSSDEVMLIKMCTNCKYHSSHDEAFEALAEKIGSNITIVEEENSGDIYG